MKVICTQCGGEDVTCEAWVNPNKNNMDKALDHFSDESFYYGYCTDCHSSTVLSDCEEVIQAVDYLSGSYKEATGKKPASARCEITYRDENNQYGECLIGLNGQSKDKEGLLCCVDGIDGLKKLCLPESNKDFIVTWIIEMGS
ncbi:hypothetical protein M2448_002387 [Dysgonomonas sp. PF1-14]|uniref:hypothetical protein n=1 Tax=Dysgonomonas sp. PF1-14 TaxID=2940630 RepID=UPI002475667D|nr:hypothetical protein [Dysgonomonas sp. PF1-14]MDH6309450.1 hypothetical protein [Dysgonomonas sp. PF1-14]